METINAFMGLVAHGLSWIFVAGAIGCLFALPITAFKMFSVLFEKDTPGER